MFKFIRFVSKKTLNTYIFIKAVLKVYYLIAPLITMKFIDSVMQKDLEKLKFFALLNISIFLVGQYLDYLLDVFMGKAYSESYINIFKEINYNLENYNLITEKLDEEKINQEIGQNFELIKPFIFEYPINIVFSVITIILIFLISFQLSPLIAVLMIIVVPVSAYISYKYGRIISNYASDHLEDMEEVKGYMVDQYKLTKEERFLNVKQLTPLDKFFNRFSNNLLKKTKAEAFINNILIYGMLNAAILATGILSGWLVFIDKITIGVFTAFQIYISQFWTPIEFLFEARSNYLSVKPAINNFQEFLNLSKIELFDEKINNIKLFNYVGLDENGVELHNPLTLNLERNTLNVIMGDNGVGKTTLIEGILNITDRYEGKILINDKSPEKLSNDIVYIPGNSYISKYGILKNRYNGSLGQKKLAQIELALKTDKSVYIFDEPTNYLDVNNKIIVLNKIKDLLSMNKIVIIVTHDELITKNDNINLIKIGAKR
ncbi:ATP-binding cassette domain-containing protein [Soehngenia longivitae]|uniref:ATP-binding cassette domain-containing protein n=1 Tax=Soehngenia longivitae TaxID=2562294 RepID=A0A4Z0D6A7_9FIRM|nr:ATP-binding cassette domain-containing protein [Soehngenia longivitae]TFZ40420.1 ATP-binding cassette domain-containing protein [Soehngenia longivitae]